MPIRLPIRSGFQRWNTKEYPNGEKYPYRHWQKWLFGLFSCQNLTKPFLYSIWLDSERISPWARMHTRTYACTHSRTHTRTWRRTAARLHAQVFMDSLANPWPALIGHEHMGLGLVLPDERMHESRIGRFIGPPPCSIICSMAVQLGIHELKG